MRTFLLYAVMVGIPAAGTSLVLRAGGDVQAPPAVWGTWALEAPPGASLPGCASSAAPALPATLTIGQSGDSLTIVSGEGNRPLAARLAWGSTSGASIAATRQPEETVRMDGTLVALSAAIDLASTPRVMQGTLTTMACGAEAAVAFRATRRVERPVKAGKR